MNNTSKIASCNICLLSSAMKDCPSCPLNPGNLKLTPAERDTVSNKYLLKPEGLKP